ncbi:MAG TPA: hypothetical protein ENN97_09575 [Phycisphaerales bacterium]|nr:hypothetical protein [Phycisphaerales bacterium]
MRTNRRHRGFVLILAVALIPLFGFAMLLTTSHTAQLSRSLRAVEQQTEYKNLRLSAEAWLAANRQTVLNLEPGESMALPIGDVAAHPTDCTVELTSRDSSGATAIIAFQIEQGQKLILVTHPFSL